MKTQNGNVLFLILIAVALFAALSYAITSSTRTSGSSNLSDEKAALLASSITQYGTSLENAILRMRLSNGCLDTDISFEFASSPYSYVHSPVVADKCKVFNSAGGNMFYTLPKNWFSDTDPGFDPASTIWAIGDYSVTNIGTSAPELLLTLYGLDEKICDQINKKLGISYSGAVPVEDIDGGAVEFSGTYNVRADNIGDDTNSVFKGQASGCLSDYGSFVYYHVVIPR